jgi:hypothetical protein
MFFPKLVGNTAIESFLSNTFCIISFGSDLSCRAPTTFKLEGEVTSLSESSQGEVGRLLGEVNCD